MFQIPATTPQIMNSVDVTELLLAARKGDHRAMEVVWPLVYQELRALAQRQIRRENEDVLLQPTALVHEAYVKLAAHQPEAHNRAHFVAIAARAMRQVLVEEARRRQSAKRGGDFIQTTLGSGNDAMLVRSEELLMLDAALDKLDERQRQIVELRFFGGSTEEETAALLGVSDRTVRREWTKARAWLYRELYPEA
jgi:RNA polymerase sigma factor (TIGR02999 family)